MLAKNCCRPFFVAFALFVLSQNLAAQADLCGHTPHTRWKPYLNWIAPNQPATRALLFKIQQYSIPTFTLSVSSFGNGMSNMIGFGNVVFTKNHLEVISCLKPRNVALRNPATGVATTTTIRCDFYQAVQNGSNPGFILLGNSGYTHVSTKGDIHLFKRDNGGEFLVVAIEKIQLN